MVNELVKLICVVRQKGMAMAISQKINWILMGNMDIEYRV